MPDDRARNTHGTDDRRFEEPSFGDDALETELERRLALIESPDFRDPAREDFTTMDFVKIAVLVVVISVAFSVWGY